MKNKICRLLGIMAVMILVSGQVWAAQIISAVEDASVAMRVKNGYTSTLTIVVTGAGTNMTVAADAHTNTIDGNVSNTITLLNTALLGVTNAAGTASLTINTEPSLLTDSTDGELLDGTYTAAADKWLELLWDTSAHLSFDLYFPSRTYQTGVSAFILEKVQGVPGGTGNATVSVYKNRTLIGQKIIASPEYRPSSFLSGGTNSIVINTFDTLNDVSLDWDLNMPFTGKDPVIIRATRATTATTGVIGAVVPNP